MTIDPIIAAVFGPAPADISLNASITTLYSVISCVGLGLAIAAVALRFYVRTMNNTNNLAADDYTMLFALICTAALVATTLIAGQYGSGKHIWTQTVDRLMILIKVVFAEPWVYAASVTSSKISILLLYKRLFYARENSMNGINRVFTIMFWVAFFLVGVYPLIMWIVMATACRPVSFFWRQYAGATDGSCIQVLDFFLAFGIVNMIVDVFILIVPIPLIMRLQMNTRKKISVSGIMLLGSLVCVASIVRIRYLFLLTTAVDVSWTLGPAFAWSSLEPSIAMISACLPTFAPLFRSLRNKESNSGSNQNYMGRTGGQKNLGNQSSVGTTAAFRNTKTPYIRFDDDEMELTAKTAAVETDSVSRTSSDNKMTGITVKREYHLDRD